MALTPGARLGPYEILAAIGAGGMGEVYRARDTRLDRIVAIKVLPVHLADRPELRERFEREDRKSRCCREAVPTGAYSRNGRI
jgi:eukaryotic-like serine/threonine-protein kinase